MGLTVAEKIIQANLVDGKMAPGEEIGLKINQTLTQDATGTLVMLELEAMGAKSVKTEISAQYIDHNLIQEDYKNADDHLFLQSACQKFGIWYSRAGNGVSHPVHMQHFGIPGKVLLGSDSHTCAGGSLGMIAIGAGGLEVATAMMGDPYYFTMPKIFGIELTGKLPEWVSAKDVILEMLRRHGVNGGTGYILEYFGPGLLHLSAMDRHVIANMGAELGATTSIFPSDSITKTFLSNYSRGADWREISADEKAHYAKIDKINLSQLEPLIALPTSPGNVVSVREVAGKEIYQTYIGSSANPGFRDFAISAAMVKGKQVNPNISYDINPSSRAILEDLIHMGYLGDMVEAGARIHQAGCNGCIGMGQAPASGRNSLRTVPRNFPGRSGTKEDSVFLCSPETATASALTGKITDPRDLKIPYPEIHYPQKCSNDKALLQSPLEKDKAEKVMLIKGPNIGDIPEFSPIPSRFSFPVLLKVGDNISTDEILPAGARVLPFRSNIKKISEFCFEDVDKHYVKRAKENHRQGHVIIAGKNYGQGSSREHAALAPRYLGLQLVIAKQFARIHYENLVNFGIMVCTFANESDYDNIDLGDEITLDHLFHDLTSQNNIRGKISNKTHHKNLEIELKHMLTARDIEMLKEGGVINWIKSKF